MSQPTPPPSVPPAGTPDAAPQQPAEPVAAPTAQPVPQQAAPEGTPQYGFPHAPVPPAAPARNNLVLGLAAALGAALVSAAVYGTVIGVTEYEIGWAAVGVGFLVGLAAGRVGGRNPVLPVVSALVSLGAVYLGQLIGTAMIGADELGVGFTEVFFEQFGLVQEAWKAGADPMSFLFFAIAGYVAFQSARKAGD
ncbi:hypothetical protein [Streptomyces fructofermentans]|uniref:hypothetical protein n=1 Tax=Streptomyces fructofermentans TaxID=152141 RepID=UPI00340016FA